VCSWDRHQGGPLFYQDTTEPVISTGKVRPLTGSIVLLDG